MQPNFQRISRHGRVLKRPKWALDDWVSDFGLGQPWCQFNGSVFDEIKHPVALSSCSIQTKEHDHRVEINEEQLSQDIHVSIYEPYEDFVMRMIYTSVEAHSTETVTFYFYN